MATRFNQRPATGPALITGIPAEQVSGKSLAGGLEHRPFSDAEIKQAFDTFDLDKNRFVGAAEIGHILELIGEDVTDEEIDEMIRICDTDGDGQVTFDEFYKMMTQPPPPLPPPLPVAVVQKQKRSRAAAAKRYAQSSTGSQALGGVESALAVPSSSAAERIPGVPSSSPSQKQKKGTVENTATAANQSFRTQSVESLVKKLSGGMGKIKPSQIKKVYQRFRDIDVDKSGAIDYAEFIQALEIEDNMISRQMYRVFDMDGSGSIELKEFIVVLSRYTSAAKSEKLKFAFMMFDEDGSGFIERQELLDMLGASFVVEGYSREELEDRADRVFNFLGISRDGAISYEDFLKLSSARNGLIYPIEEERNTLKDLSINKMLEEVREDGS